jgi:alpha-glucosidase
MALMRFFFLLAASAVSASTLATRDTSDPLSSCPGYKASNIKTSNTGLTADLTLAGKACNVYGTDLTQLTLTVTYETGMRLLPTIYPNS